MGKTWSQVELIREAFHYKSRFDGSTMVFKIDYPVTEDPLFPSLVKDLALLSQTGFKVVIIPGAKELIDTILKENKIELRYNDSLRISSKKAMPYVQMAAFHSASSFMTGFSSSRVEAVIGNFIRARGLGVVNGIDMEHTGTVDRVYLDSLKRILDLGMVPILPCIGWNSSGRPYNVSSDEIAMQTAVNLKAEKLFIVSLCGGIKKDLLVIPNEIKTNENGTVSLLTPYEAGLVLERNRNEKNKANSEGERIIKELEMAVKTLEEGVNRVHIIDAREEGAVLRELFSNLGAGTMIHADEYESIRSIRSRDIIDILRLMEPLMQEGILVRRTAEDIQNKKDDYSVIVVDSQIRACGALHDWGEKQGEIAAIATDPSHTEAGLGSRMVRYLTDKAKKQNLNRVFILTTSSPDWFESLGFNETSMETLPEKRRTVYDHLRNSRVFALNLE